MRSLRFIRGVNSGTALGLLPRLPMGANHLCGVRTSHGDTQWGTMSNDSNVYNYYWVT